MTDDEIIRAEAVESPEGYVKVTIVLQYPSEPASAYLRRDTALALVASIVRETKASLFEVVEAIGRAGEKKP